MFACAVLLALMLHGGSVRAQEPASAGALADVKDRYAAAAYEEALALLDAKKPDASDTAVRSEIEQYRALCLLALGKKADADQAIERLVTLDPRFAADSLDAAAWIRDAFRAVRRRALPGIVTSRYEIAKGNVLAKSYETAVPQLKEVIALLDDADLGGTDERWRRDLRTLAQGFLDLAAAVPPPARADQKAADAQPAAQRPGSEAVVPAVPVREQMPAWPAELRATGAVPHEGVIEVAIDEKGAVTSATISVSVHPLYDRWLVQAARTWQYRPATRGGVAVASVRRIRVVVNTGRSPGSPASQTN